MQNVGKVLMRAGENVSKLPSLSYEQKIHYFKNSLMIGGGLGILRGSYEEGKEWLEHCRGEAFLKWTIVGVTWPLSLPAMVAFRIGGGGSGPQ